jgi:hypothetical protein
MKKNQNTSLNIKIKQSDKQALVAFALSQGEVVAVVVRRIIKEELTRRGFLKVNENAGLLIHQEYSLMKNYSDTGGNNEK